MYIIYLYIYQYILVYISELASLCCCKILWLLFFLSVFNIYRTRQLLPPRRLG